MAMSSGSFGFQILDGLLEDTFNFGKEEAPSSRLTYLIRAERRMAENFFEVNNTANSNDFTIASTDARFNAALPLSSNNAVEKSSLGISVVKNNHIFNANQGLSNVNITNISDQVKLMYGARLNGFLDVGFGISQSNQESSRNTDIDYNIKLSPSEVFTLDFGNEKVHSGEIAKIYYNGEILIFPVFSALNKQTGKISALFGDKVAMSLTHQKIDNLDNRTELTALFKPGKKVGLFSRLGKNEIEQNIRFDNIEDRYSYIAANKESLFGSIGIIVDNDRSRFEFDLLGSATDLLLAGGIYNLYSPGLLLDSDLVDKSADLNSHIRTNGCRAGIESSMNERLNVKADISYLKVLFDGDARIWNNWFFGMARKLDSEYVIPIDSADILVGCFRTKYLLNDGFEINYAFKQLIPIAFQQTESSGNTGNTGGSSSVSGGNIQTFALACYF